MADALTTTIGERIRAHGVETTDLSDQLARAGRYPLLRPDALAYSAVHYTAALRGVRSLDGDILSWKGHARYHVSTQGWPAIAYAIGLSLSGRVFLLRPVLEMGYHAFTANASSLGISVDMGVQEPTPAALASLEVVLEVLHHETPELPNLDAAGTYGHKELTFLDPRNAGTSCPGLLLGPVQRYRAGGDLDGQGAAGLPDPDDAALEALYLENRHRLGPKRVPGAGQLARDWAGEKILLCLSGVLAARDGVAWEITAQGIDDLVTYWTDDELLTLY